MKKTDVVIVGAGAVGCAVARELPNMKSASSLWTRTRTWEETPPNQQRHYSYWLRCRPWDAGVPAGCGGQSNV